MTLTGYKWGGVAIRTATGKLAGDPNCCCDQSGGALRCCCQDQTAGHNLLATITSGCAAIDGLTITLTTLHPGHGGCLAWQGISVIVICPSGNFKMSIVVECMGAYGSASDYRIWVSYDNSDCGLGSQVLGESPDSGVACDPFFLKWSGLIAPHNSGPAPSPTACDCCTSSDTMDVEISII